ncbi:MAG: HAD-IA family hydrolase [Parvibaculum sp.]
MTGIRAVIFDVDGVLVTHQPHQGSSWSAHLKRDLDLDPSHLQEAFFLPHWGDIVSGRASIEERLTPVLAEIAPHLSAENLLTYWFEADGHIDHALLDRLRRWREETDAGFHLATNQEHRRASYLWQTMGLNAHFDAIHYSANIGHAKPEEGFYQTIENRLGLAGSQILLFDDQSKNIEAAKTRGWRAFIWEGAETLEKVGDLRRSDG